MYLKPILTITIVVASMFYCKGQPSQAELDKIQIAFLLDVSGSMDQLILKAKSQFWRMANYLATATKNGKPPIVEFGIVIYGLDNQGVFQKLLTNFNSDLDSVALNLHDIEVGGGMEFCWTTINFALDTLTWTKRKEDLKLIIIAGNESFTQEQIDIKKVINKARKLDVTINTIYCNAKEDSISDGWKKAAEQGRGDYFTISLKDSLNLEENFLDKKLSDFNDKLNRTYIPFGPMGQKSYSRMLLQDMNSKMAGAPFFRERVVYKASESFTNPTWDLVDAFNSDSTILLRLDKLEGVSDSGSENLKGLISDKQYARDSYKEVIKLRYNMIKKYVGENKGDLDLDVAVKAIIDKEGRKRNFEFKN